MSNHYVKEVCQQLAERPEEWAYDHGRFRLVHAKSGVAVWVSNGRYGIHIECCGRTIWGGVTFLSTFALSPDHWRLHRAVKSWEAGQGGLFAT